MSNKNNEFFKTLQKDLHIFKTMNDLEIHNYLHNLLKNIYSGDFAFRKSLIETTEIKSYSIDKAIKENKLKIFHYNNDSTFEIFNLKDFALLTAEAYKNRLRRGRL